MKEAESPHARQAQAPKLHHTVFVSYSGDDGGVASAVCSALEARAIHCWMASRDVRVGQPYSGQQYPGQQYPGQSYTGQPGYTPPSGAPYVPPPPFASGYMGRDIPTGAIILIGLGILFLFGSLGLLHENWVSHGWPLLIIGLGIWIIFRRTQSLPPSIPPDPIHSPGHTHATPVQTGPTDTPGGQR